jgi:hypothetical protein
MTREPMLRVISLGAGVQSTTMALMAAHGEIGPMPHCAIFADTQWEPKSVYDHLAWLSRDGFLPFPVLRVTAGNLRQDIMNHHKAAGRGRVAAVPWFMRMPNGDEAMGRRQCTKQYKLAPIQRKVRELSGEKRPRKGSCETWIGISTDEVMRVRPSRVQYVVHRYPLIDRRMNRNDCLRWLERQGYGQPPKSACIGCPFHSNTHWRALRDGPAHEWQDAIEVDAAIRSQPGFRGQQFMHRSLKPLAEVDLSTAEDHGQLNLFNNECEGMCGV